ncbi:nucleoside-diphosphate-sugar pyrophosphorylase [Kyrpidia spormannii]|uniref:Nucleoside-diphosphate-sugar pyrophosphorylase n=1 Tax=Kyrpidia spormannii TaxID=2055160 RepID=A0A2K8N812_9BACL|nr:sugar phosphate nucleotidyltransferase [Kyrpidia spormannii]ATY85245.1 nucleoside-diphosphate-sugar pyrophosphorylase [Kyrpidia spormannii]
MKAVIMAGGRGQRLRPLTDVIPKPLLPLDGVPMVEILIRQLKSQGFDDLVLTVGYRADLLRTYLGGGEALGARITYIEETEPRGTAGSLSQLSADQPLLVVNGDILTTAGFCDIVAKHEEYGAALTLVSYPSEIPVDFGVLHTEGERVLRVEEKPRLPALVSTGIYVLSPDALAMVPDGRYDMTDLIERLIAEGRRVCHYPLSGVWIDVGRMEDFRRAQKLFAADKGRFLPSPSKVKRKE